MYIFCENFILLRSRFIRYSLETIWQTDRPGALAVGNRFHPLDTALSKKVVRTIYDLGAWGSLREEFKERSNVTVTS